MQLLYISLRRPLLRLFHLNVDLDAPRSDKICALPLQFLQGSLFSDLIGLNYLEFLLQTFTLVRQVVLDSLGVSCHPPLLLIELVLEISDCLRLKEKDLALLLKLKAE